MKTILRFLLGLIGVSVFEKTESSTETIAESVAALGRKPWNRSQTRLALYYAMHGLDEVTVSETDFLRIIGRSWSSVEAKVHRLKALAENASNTSYRFSDLDEEICDAWKNEEEIDFRVMFYHTASNLSQWDEESRRLMRAAQQARSRMR